MKEHRIIIQGELTDLNTYIKALNGSRWSGNTIKHDETLRVEIEARMAKIGAIEHYPVRVAYQWYLKDRRKDLDNVSFAKKFINDGLVAAKVLKDDSQKYIAGFSDEFFIDKENPRVEVTIKTE